MKTRGVFQKKGSSTWWIRYGDGSKFPSGEPRIRYEKAGTRSTAEKLVALRKAAAMKGEKLPTKTAPVLVKDLVEAVLQNYRDRKFKDISHVETRLRLHITPFFGKMDGNAVTSDDIKRYKASRQKAGAENATINRELAILRKAYTLALESTPPLVDAAPKISKLAESGAREGFVEAEQFQALVAAADELWLKAIVTIAYTFAFRRGELLGLKVNQIDLDRGTITLAAHSTKNKTARVVVMTNGVLELVSACVQDKGSGDYVFSRGRGPVKDFRGAWWNLCVEAGLGKFVDGKHEGLLFHDLRRSGVRNLVRAGVTESVAMRISGHKTRSVFDRYNIISEADLRDAAAKLERLEPTESDTEFGQKAAVISITKKALKRA